MAAQNFSLTDFVRNGQRKSIANKQRRGFPKGLCGKITFLRLLFENANSGRPSCYSRLDKSYGFRGISTYYPIRETFHLAGLHMYGDTRFRQRESCSRTFVIKSGSNHLIKNLPLRSDSTKSHHVKRATN